MLSIIHIKGERQPSGERKFAINLPNYCSFYMMDKSIFSFDSSILYVLGGVLGQTQQGQAIQGVPAPGAGMEAGVFWGAEALVLNQGFTECGALSCPGESIYLLSSRSPLLT